MVTVQRQHGGLPSVAHFSYWAKICQNVVHTWIMTSKALDINCKQIGGRGGRLLSPEALGACMLKSSRFMKAHIFAKNRVAYRSIVTIFPQYSTQNNRNTGMPSEVQRIHAPENTTEHRGLFHDIL